MSGSDSSGNDLSGNERAEELGDGALPADPDLSIQPPDESAPHNDDPAKPEGDE